ncbi:ABC transporter permease [soil metagenome]
MLRSMFISAWNSLRTLYCHQALLIELSKRDIADQFVGQAFGNLWAIFHPLFLMGIYLFVFAFVFRTKLGGTYAMPLDYTTYILAGLIPWMSLQLNLAKSCSAITGSTSLVKQVVFPIEILPAKIVLATLFSQIVSIGILIVYVLAVYHYIPIMYTLLPFLVLMQLLGTIGLAFLLSSVCVFFRDLREFVTLYCIAGVFLLPITYLPAWVPPIFKPFLYLNPFSYLIWCYQDILYYGRFEHMFAWPVMIGGTLFIFMLGTYLFANLKSMFGDAL